jgi:hypothetical protein
MNLRRVTPAGNLDRLPGRKGESARLYCGDLDHRHCGGSARSLDRVADQTAESSREGSFDPPHPLTEKSTADGVAEPGFRDDLYRARDVRGDYTFGEQILDIADDGTNDWVTAKNGAQVVNKELVLRSKLRIEARQFHMSRLHVQTWGEKQTIDIKSDWALLSEDERKRKADELIQMIRELREPPMQPPPLVYRPEEAPDEKPSARQEIGS